MCELREVGLIRRYEIAGSVRRQLEHVNDVDIIVEPIDTHAFDEWLVTMFGRKSNRQPRTRGLVEGIQLDFYPAGPHEWGSHLFTLTGPHSFYREARRRAESNGRRLDRHGVWMGGTRVAGLTEREVFLALGLCHLPPADR